MTVSILKLINGPMVPTAQHVAMPRPQVGIERLPPRRMANEPRESMNCKSCRKRKIKCNRLRPSCEACQVFQCQCIYDAVPKKRGPKTDVLEALLKRVDGLEAKLKEKNTNDSSTVAPGSSSKEKAGLSDQEEEDRQPKRLAIETTTSQGVDDSVMFSPVPESEASPVIPPQALLDTYFSRFHAKPFYILDESSVRSRIQLGNLPSHQIYGIYAVAARYTTNTNGHPAPMQMSRSYAQSARNELDLDEPSVDSLQTLLLLAIAFIAQGRGKKAYMMTSNAVVMAVALELHREVDATNMMNPVERELCRRLFWSCYLLDRFVSCGSKRPSLLTDDTIQLRLPSWSPSLGALPLEGDFFQSGPSSRSGGKMLQGSMGMLIDICRILGTTNRYLAAGGVKGDSHFPWHSLSKLSQIRQDLNIWAAGTSELFHNPNALLCQPDSTVLVLSKLVYHLIYCLIYRPFLPVNLADLAITGQHQSWQIEATNLCFIHANAIAELVDLGRQVENVEWPAFAGYCIATAGTVHVHGAYYDKNIPGNELNVFAASTDLLSLEMQHLTHLCYEWESIQHQYDTLLGICGAHAELVKALAASGMRYSPAFHLEDFFDRYFNIGGPGGESFEFDPASLSLLDVVARPHSHDRCRGDPSSQTEEDIRGVLKRKLIGPPTHKLPELNPMSSFSISLDSQPNGHIGPLGQSRPLPSMTGTNSMSAPAAVLREPSDFAPVTGGMGSVDPTNGYAIPGNPTNSSSQSLPTSPYGPQFGFAPGPGTTSPNSIISSGTGSYDGMFERMAAAQAFNNPQTWQGTNALKSAGRVTDPTDDCESPETSQSEEKDPFLSLLEQIAEDEQHQSGGQLDFFFNSADGLG